jgi:hypothetical protein
MAVAIVKTPMNEQTRAQRALVRRILRVRPDVSPALLVAILGHRMLRTTRDRSADRP